MLYDAVREFGMLSKDHKYKSGISLIKHKGFTLIEVMVGVAMLGIIATVAMPSLVDFRVQMRVDNEVSELQRLILTARNSAINMGQPVTVCPLSNANICTNNWENQLTAFINLNNNNALDNDDTIIKVKQATFNSDKLQYSSNNNITFRPTGFLTSSANANTRLSYCPYGYTDKNRGILISATGRPIISSDNGSGVDVFRLASGNTITCN
jgi:prepilin-type N-terminal cleavage/methylation domain-containing protein